MPSLRSLFTSFNCLIFVVPEVETTVLPLRSSILATLLALLVTYLLAVT